MEIYYYSCMQCEKEFTSKEDDPNCPRCGGEDVDFLRTLSDEETEGFEHE